MTPGYHETGLQNRDQTVFSRATHRCSGKVCCTPSTIGEEKVNETREGADGIRERDSGAGGKRLEAVARGGKVSRTERDQKRTFIESSASCVRVLVLPFENPQC